MQRTSSPRTRVGHCCARNRTNEQALLQVNQLSNFATHYLLDMINDDTIRPEDVRSRRLQHGFVCLVFHDLRSLVSPYAIWVSLSYGVRTIPFGVFILLSWVSQQGLCLPFEFASFTGSFLKTWATRLGWLYWMSVSLVLSSGCRWEKGTRWIMSCHSSSRHVYNGSGLGLLVASICCRIHYCLELWVGHGAEGAGYFSSAYILRSMTGVGLASSTFVPSIPVIPSHYNQPLGKSKMSFRHSAHL